MTIVRRIKYQSQSFWRQVALLYRGYGVPSWLTGPTARFSYLFLLAAFVVIYVCQVSSAAGIGYEMRDLQRNNDALRQEIRQLNVGVATYNALPNLEKRISYSGLSNTADIIYMKSIDSIVAKK